MSCYHFFNFNNYYIVKDIILGDLAIFEYLQFSETIFETKDYFFECFWGDLKEYSTELLISRIFYKRFLVV